MPRSLKSNIGFQYALQFAKYVFPFVSIPYLTRVLGPEIYAVRAYVLATMTMFQVFLDFGFKAYGARVIALAKGDIDVEKQETSAICILRLMLCAVGALVAFFVFNLIPILRENIVYAWVAYAATCLKAGLPDFVFQGREDMRVITYRYVGSQTVATVLIFILVHNQSDLLWVAILDALAALIAFVWSWCHVVFKFNIWPTVPGAATLQASFAESGVYFLSNASTTIFTSLTTVFIGIYVKNDAQISYWSLSMSIISALQQMFTPITNSLYPRITRTGNFKELRQFLLVGTPVVVALGIAICLLRVPIMSIVGGDAYVDGAIVLAMVMPVFVFSYPAMLLGYPVLAASGMSKQLTATSVISATFHIVGLFALALLGLFTIPVVCLLRCCTELVLLIARIFYSSKVLSHSCVQNSFSDVQPTEAN